MDIDIVRQSQNIVNGGQTAAERKRISNIIDDFARDDGNPDLSMKEIESIKDAFFKADINHDNLYNESEISNAEEILKTEYYYDRLHNKDISLRDQAFNELAKDKRAVELVVNRLLHSADLKDKDSIDIALIVKLAEPALPTLIDALSMPP